MHPTQPKSKQGKLSTAPFSASKKSGMKRENPPCTPYKRKARGKENNPGALSTGLSAGAYAGVCERIRAREAIRRCGKIARPQDDPATRQKRIDRAKHLVMRKAPECLQTFWLILKNGSNREKSICEIMAKTRTRKK